MTEAIFRLRDLLSRRGSPRSSATLFTIGVVSLLSPGLSSAALIEMEMTGTISAVQDSLGLLPFAHVGDQVVYRF